MLLFGITLELDFFVCPGPIDSSTFHTYGSQACVLIIVLCTKRHLRLRFSGNPPGDTVQAVPQEVLRARGGVENGSPTNERQSGDVTALKTTSEAAMSGGDLLKIVGYRRGSFGEKNTECSWNGPRR